MWRADSQVLNSGGGGTGPTTLVWIEPPLEKTKFQEAVTMKIFVGTVNIYIFISPQMVDNKQYEKKNKNKQT